MLGIETSCDDTGAAIVSRQGNIVAEELHSQTRITTLLGGVLPLVASHLHSDHIERVVSNCFTQSGLQWKDLDAIAVTVKPGLAQSLAVGLNFAKSKAMEHNIPIMPIHHMEAHALTARLEQQIEFPYLALLVSGGHALLVLVTSVRHFVLLGTGLDISPGDCFDKVARRLKVRNLGTPFSEVAGGRSIELLASEGHPGALEFSEVRSHEKDCDFSFSGLQSLALQRIGELEKVHKCEGNAIIPNVRDFCASFQFAVCRTIGRRVARAMRYLEIRRLMPSSALSDGSDWEWNTVGAVNEDVTRLVADTREKCGNPREGHVPTLVVSGGVASNAFLRQCLSQVCTVYGYRLVCPPARLCTDNGVMIAWNAYERFYGKDADGLRENLITDVASLAYEIKSPLGPSVSEDIRACDIDLPRIKFL